MEYENMPVVELTSPDDIGACPSCGCNGAMSVSTGSFKTGKFYYWFRCYNCETDWRMPEIDWTIEIGEVIKDVT